MPQSRTTPEDRATATARLIAAIRASSTKEAGIDPSAIRAAIASEKAKLASGEGLFSESVNRLRQLRRQLEST